MLDRSAGANRANVRDSPAEPSHAEEDPMPQDAWSPKRERQYKHIKESEREAGRSEDRAEEIAARTVNKQRADAGETRSGGRRKS
jgi:hypothetical protein